MCDSAIPETKSNENGWERVSEGEKESRQENNATDIYIQIFFF